MAQLVKHPILGFGSGHDLTVHKFEPCVGLCADSAEPAWDSLSPFLSGTTQLMRSLSLPLSLKTNKFTLKTPMSFTNVCKMIIMLPYKLYVCDLILQSDLLSLVHVFNIFLL